MDWKKYAILLPPALIIFMLLAFHLPSGQKQYAFGVPLVFWSVYYIWVYIDKKSKKDSIDKSSSENIEK